MGKLKLKTPTWSMTLCFHIVMLTLLSISTLSSSARPPAAREHPSESYDDGGKFPSPSGEDNDYDPFNYSPAKLQRRAETMWKFHYNRPAPPNPNHHDGLIGEQVKHILEVLQNELTPQERIVFLWLVLSLMCLILAFCMALAYLGTCIWNLTVELSILCRTTAARTKKYRVGLSKSEDCELILKPETV